MYTRGPAIDFFDCFFETESRPGVYVSNCGDPGRKKVSEVNRRPRCDSGDIVAQIVALIHQLPALEVRVCIYHPRHDCFFGVVEYFGVAHFRSLIRSTLNDTAIFDSGDGLR